MIGEGHMPKLKYEVCMSVSVCMGDLCSYTWKYAHMHSGQFSTCASLRLRWQHCSLCCVCLHVSFFESEHFVSSRIFFRIYILFSF